MLIFMMVVLLLSLLSDVQGQTSDQQQNMPDLPQTVHPSKGLVISVLTIMFAITFLLLAYVKFCRISPLEATNQNHTNTNLQNGLARSGSRFSGINREVIEALPFFKFSSLKGSKNGLECTVCLSKFEDYEILRLLPKCHHAFHMSCIDKWLESHSTCPLCRYKVEPEDIKNTINFSLSSRFLRIPSNLTEDPNVEIYVQREPSNRGSSRFSIGSVLWEEGKSKKQEQPLIADQEGDNSSGTGINTNTKWAQEHVHHHKLKHRIVVSDVVTRNRWSDLNSSDLISLSFEMMLNDVSSPRFSPPLEPSKNNNGEKIHHGSSSSNNNNDDDEENSFTALNNPSTEKRSMSEIANVPRFDSGMRKQSRVIEYSGGDSGRKEERLWRIWMPIAQRTVQWFATREIGNSHQHKSLVTNV